MMKITTTNVTSTKPRSASLLDAVGRTPLIELRNVASELKPGVRVFAKLEWFNPSGSVKDRGAANIIRAAVADGKLAGKVLLDSTSGNMGISYVTLGGSLGIPVSLAIPGSASSERFKMLRALGAEMHESDALEGSDGAIVLARKLKDESPDRYFYADQYNNEANWQAHYKSTGPEIWEQTSGTATHFVVGLGTTGTLIGTGRYLREQNPAVKIIGFEPDGPFHGLEGLKYMPTAIKPGIYDPDFADETLRVSSEDAHEMTRRLSREEGLFGGVSSGAAAAVALSVAAGLSSGTVVTLFPDAGYKYLSDVFWGFGK